MVLGATSLGQPATAAAGSGLLTLGSTGPKVTALNERLGRLSYLRRGADSPRFGARTYHAVVAFQLQEGLAADGVVGPQTRGALAEARRPRPRLSAAGRRIEVWRGRQLAYLVRDGRVRRTFHVSTGAAGYTTPSGTFTVSRREERSWSVPYRVWLPWAAYFNGGIALHGHAQVPTYPASHGCVRVPMPFARAVYRFAALGTRVDVVA
jgi:lipoprotein-anchoring transpeptidase ErfK/SrfK